MRACFWAMVRPGFAFLMGLLRCGVRVGVPFFVGTVVWFGRGEGVWPEGRFLGLVGAIVCCLFCVWSGLRVIVFVVVQEDGVLGSRLDVESELALGPAIGLNGGCKQTASWGKVTDADITRLLA